MNQPTITPILKTIKETHDTKTFHFLYPKHTKPGQFFMIWIPGVDEIPMSVSYINKDIKGITFRQVGDATSALFSLKTGDKIGVRGPYGNGFSLRGTHILFVGGGTGIAMLAPAIEHARRKKISSSVIIGAKTAKEVFFEKRLQHMGATVYITTDDGSKGYKGFASDYAQHLLAKTRFSSVLTCGPEHMMKTLLDYCGKIPFQASLERYMKCSIGICGQCCIGKGLRVCIDGPIFNGKTLRQTKDFGVFRRDASGKKKYF